MSEICGDTGAGSEICGDTGAAVMILTGGMDSRLWGGQCVVNWALPCARSNKVILDLLLTLQVASFFSH